jgi:hypothetical protein
MSQPTVEKENIQKTVVGEKPLIYLQMAQILKEIEPVLKDKQMDAKAGGYKYRSIDGVYDSLHKTFGQHQVFLLPEVVDKQYSDIVTSNEKRQVNCRVQVKYTFFAIDGSSISTIMPGEGNDSGDKATAKALSNALKYLLIQTFLIPTGEDTDHESTPEKEPKEKKSISKKDAIASTKQKAPDQPSPAQSQSTKDDVQTLLEADLPDYPDDLEETPAAALQVQAGNSVEKFTVHPTEKEFVLVPITENARSAKAVAITIQGWDLGSMWIPLAHTKEANQKGFLYVKKWVLENKLKEFASTT